jgi:tRNA (guanine-N7-)-methyltransferase
MRSRPYSDAPRLPEGERVDLDAWLGGAGPIELEIGPGRGMFLLERSAAAPEARLFGIEIRRKWASLVDARLCALGRRARVVCEDARVALPRLGPDGCLARAYLLFPDPWWKKRHQKRAVLGDVLLAELARLLAPAAELFVETDVASRAEAYETRIGAHPAFEPAGDAPPSPRLAANPYGAKTNREKRADADGLPVHRMRWRRVTSAG